MESNIGLKKKVIIDYYNTLIIEVNNIRNVTLIDSFTYENKDNSLIGLCLILKCQSNSEIFLKLLYNQVLELARKKKIILYRYEELNWNVLFSIQKSHKNVMDIRSTIMTDLDPFNRLNTSVNII